MNNEKLYINGEYIDSESGQWINVENPTTEEIIARVPRANQKDVDKAVEAASNSLEAWSNLDLEKRIEYVEKYNQWMKDHSEEFLDTFAKELGSPLGFAKTSQYRLQIRRTDNFIKQVKNIEFEKELEGGGRLRKEAVGVVAAITPWNYPLGQIIQKVIPALLVGCTVVLKPSQKTPLSAYLLVQGFDEVGLPKGVLNLVTGKGSEIGDMLSSHPQVDMVSFTGSTKAGGEVGKRAMEGVKKISLELGGKSPAIFMESADIKLGVKKVCDSIFLNTGQTCSALSRAVVLEDKKDEIIEEFKKQAAKYKVGDPFDKNTDIGPLSSEKQFEKVKSYVQSGLEEGAEIVIGKVPQKTSKGYFVEPIVFDKVKPGMKIHDEEIFGPVLTITSVKDMDEAIEVANSVKYGLNAAVFGEKEEAIALARKIKSGSVIINEGKGDIDLPFGGYKMSGLGREGGSCGLEEFLEEKSLHCGE
ncbi:MAG: aldehyde dehydrogenase family protein [Finegoldia sp.]|nr:aldehyde dehydrogenase family protein [Finegoldia sp.]